VSPTYATGFERNVVATKEIILAAGVIDTPKLLMLSGIGPAEHLREHGIDVVLDLPAVGSNLQEHPGVTSPPFVINVTITSELDVVTPENINQYITNASGPLMNLSPWRHVMHGYYSSRINDDDSWPDHHVYINQMLVRLQDGTIEQQVAAELELVLTNQTGTVRLASTNYMDFPLIDPRLLEDHPTDMEKLVDGLIYFSELFLNSTTFQRMGIRWSDNIQIPQPCVGLEFASREYWTCFVRQNVDCALHPTSTARMGPNATVAVVDSRLNVFGATGLRIVDSSVMPKVPNGNTNFPSIMIGEMGARFILGEV